MWAGRMDDIMRATEELAAWRVRITKGSAQSWLEKWANQGGRDSDVLVLRSDMVFGLDHIRSALYHAKRAMDQGRNASNTLVMETLLYASGERQLQSAIRKLSPDKDTEEIVIACLRGKRLVPDIDWLPLVAMIEDAPHARMKAFGIGVAESQTVGPGKATELVLERVAAVDITKK